MAKRKIIYCPSGKASEYATYAANFYNGCSSKCQYCYNRHSPGHKLLGADSPIMKKGIEFAPLSVFALELQNNLIDLQKHGLFFSFVSDPMLKETWHITTEAVSLCVMYNIPVKVLTKNTAYFLGFEEKFLKHERKDLISIGFSLTGHDELEPFASKNSERIEKLKYLKKKGFKTFASIEPIIDFPTSKKMISETLGYCDLYKIGLLAGHRFNHDQTYSFIEWLNTLSGQPIFMKENIMKISGFDPSQLGPHFVDKSYKIAPVYFT